MTKLLLIIILTIGFSCIVFLWLTKRRRNLHTARTNRECRDHERVTGKISQAKAERDGSTRDENAPDADLSPSESQTVLENEEKPTELLDEVDVPEKSRELVRWCPVQTEPAAQDLSETPAEVVATAEHMEVMEGQCLQPEAATESTASAIEKHSASAQRSSAQVTPEETRQPVEPDLETAEVIPDTRPEKPPIYRPPVPVSTVASSRTRRQPSPRSSGNRDSELHIRIHLVFDRRGGVRSLSLVPDHRVGMPVELEINGTQGDFALAQLQDAYQDVNVPDIGLALRKGVTWQGKRSAHRRWRWVLGGRDLYVLAPGADIGLGGFISVPRLLLGEEHVVLSVAILEADVLASLTQAGCGEPEMMDETFPGVPAGWVLFRRVRPTCAVPERDQAHILNALCAKRDIEPHFVGGIRLNRRSWLFGYPPRIKFTGDISSGVEVKIDGLPTSLAADGAFEALGWDREGRHSLWFAGQLRKYSLQRGPENWDTWSAYNFGTDAAICGTSVRPVDQVRLRSVRVPSQNTVLVGAAPGQIFRCHLRSDLRAETFLAMVPFEPVWALPSDPTHVDKRSVRVVLVSGFEPVRPTTLKNTNRASNPTIAAWYTAINDAGRKGLALATDDANAIALWQSYRREAKRIWRAMRSAIR